MHKAWFQYRMSRFIVTWFSGRAAPHIDILVAFVLPYLFGDFAKDSLWMEMVQKAIERGETDIAIYNPITLSAGSIQ
jgi:hypothetical protein